jgi:outer membrane biosynthesis protein TonB
MSVVRAFLPSEIVLAAGLAVIVEGGLFILLATASNKNSVHAVVEVDQEATPIEVKPVMDDVPLLKLGSKRVKAKLPDMWVKKPPIVRQQAVAAPSPKAEATKDKIPDAPLPKPSAEPPPPDTELAKQVDPQAKPDESAKPEPEQNLPTEGAADGVKEGTETDPLKAFAVGQYRIKLSGWFNARFKPGDQIPCDELKKLRASVTASVNGDRAVTGYSITKPSGNEIFDARVKATLDAIVSGGAELPPPPPNYEDVLGTSISVGFHVPSCK